MSNDTNGRPAFPTAPNTHHGMSLRDWFAGQFLMGAAATDGTLDVSDAADQTDVDAALRAVWDNVSRAAYIAADAMLAARTQEASHE